MNNKSPAYQFYPSDFLSDGKTAVMTTEQIGVYHLLMHYCWIEGSLPNDMEDLAVLARLDVDTFTSHWEKRIQRCFEQNESGEWEHPRLNKERDKQKSYKKQKSEAGKAGAEARWGKPGKVNKSGSEMAENGENIAPPLKEDGTAIDPPMAKNSSSSSSSSSSSTSDNNTHSLAREREGYEPVQLKPPESVDEVIEIGGMRGVPEKACRIYFDLRGVDNFLRMDSNGNWKPILNWHKDIYLLYQKGALESRKSKNKNSYGKGKQSRIDTYAARVEADLAGD